ncbi:MAG: S-methyl-5-thioribose-1-phosphate isomerase [bacterium]
MEYKNLILDFEKEKFYVLDQLLLPFEEKYIQLKDVNDVYFVIKNMNIRGAPLIGIVALIGVYLSNDTESAFELLKKARPTAVNIFNYFEKLKEILKKNKNSQKEIIRDFIINTIKAEEDKNYKISQNGFFLIKKLINKNTVNILTHCNTGSLATVGLGTALGIIKYTHQELSKLGGKVFVWVDETRPYLQGSRLTAWELEKEGIEFNIITDNTASFVMSKNLVDFICVGADRIAKNGDTANKIGTLNLAILSKYFKIPFVVAAPSTSIDNSLDNLQNFKIEERNKDEVIKFKNVLITKESYNVFNPSFDVTFFYLIDYIVTEKGVFSYPFDFSKID